MTYFQEGESANLETELTKLSEIDTQSVEDTIENIGSTEISQFETCELVTNKEVADYLKTLPPTHLENIYLIQYEPNPKPESSSEIQTKIHLGIPGIDGWLSAKYSPEQAKESFWENLTYEVGLRVYIDIILARLDLEFKWSDLHHKSLEEFVLKGLGLISEKGQEGHAEDFAETYATYRLAPDALKVCSFEKYKFMNQEIFYGQEY